MSKDMNTDEASDSTDVVVVGAGLAGLAGALAAHEAGHRVVILESSDLVGGAASFSGGQVWVADNLRQREQGMEDNLEDAATYVRHLNADTPDFLEEEALSQWLQDSRDAAQYFEDMGVVRWDVIPDYPDYYQEAPGARKTGRYLTATYRASHLGDALSLLRISPHFPVGSTYDSILSEGLRASAFGASGSDSSALAEPEDLLTFGTGVVAPFLAAALERDIPVKLKHRVTRLLRDGNRVTGAVAEHDGHEVTFDGNVVLSTSGYDWDDEAARDYLGLEPSDRGSVAPRSVAGDGLRLAQAAGAEIRVFPRNRIPIQLGYPQESEPGYAVAREHSLPHTFIVNGSGQRFCDDAVYWQVIKASLDSAGDNFPCFMIWDEQHHHKYGLGATLPGENYPAEVVHRADDLASLAVSLGIDPEGLVATAGSFNASIVSGQDAEFGRGSNLTWQKFQGDPNNAPHPNLGTVERAPFFGMRLTMVSTGIGLTGIVVDPHGRALTQGGAPIPGLYAAGAAAAFTSSGIAYNSGFSLSRAISLGWRLAQTMDADRLGATTNATTKE